MRADAERWAREWAVARRVLCVRLDGMGDVLMMTPAMRALRSAAAGRTITLLTSPGAAPIAPLIPEIDGALTYAAPWTKEGAARATPSADEALVRELRGRFDAAVIFTTYTQSALPSALMCRLAGIPLRLAYARENPYALLTHPLPEREPDAGIRHEVRRQLDLAAAVGAGAADERLSLVVSAAARARVRALLSEGGMDPARPWVVVHPGATASSRRYPPDRLAIAADWLADDGLQVVVTGGPGERDLAQAVAGAMRCPAVSLAGATTVEELAALIEGAAAVVTTNSAPSHMAAALDTPVVVLYALTNPQHTPWAPADACRVLSHDVPCRNCLKSICPEQHHGCLEYITPDEIVRAVRSVVWRERAAATDAGAREWEPARPRA